MKIGIDITKKTRFDVKSGLDKKILSDYEANLFNNLKSNSKKQEFLASRWCMKEAILKTNSDLTMREISIKKKEMRPYYTDKYELSLSHEKEYCVAIAIKK